MKLPTLAVVSATVVIAAAAQPHRHAHRHAHPHLAKKDIVTETAWAPAATAYVFELEGQEIPENQACYGLENSKLSVDGGGMIPTVCLPDSSSWSSTTTSTTPSTTSSATTTSWSESSSSTSASSAGGEFWQQSSYSAPSWTAPAPAASSAPASGGGVGTSFPNGAVPCSEFPSSYGAVPLSYLGLGGWTGLQQPGNSAAGTIDNIVTNAASQCGEGMYCSYACPPGWQKSQWPSTQGATGQSVGGLLCQGGMLQLTNSGLSSSLCMQGVGGVSAQNSGGSVAAICRTDYPGTESETVPTEIQPGQTQPLTVPDAGNYYVWEGKSTSAQYYLNPPGTDAASGCQWGSPGGNIGNYAPINFGVGAKSGTTWLSIMANTPTTTATYSGTVEIQGDISGSCKYTGGQYYSDGVANSAGCTVSTSSPMLLFYQY